MSFRRWRTRLAAVMALALAGGLLALVGYVWALNWRPTDKYPFQGVDVAETNGAVDWWAVKRGGATFAYARATNANHRDTQFETNWAGIGETGLRRGATHLYSLCRLAADQANAFNTTVPRDDDALPAAVEIDFAKDCTDRPTQDVVLSELRRYITMVEGHTGKPVLLKVSKPFDALYGVTAAIARPVWAVQDFFPPDYPARRWRMWQASGMRRVDGIEGPVHWNVVAP